MDKVDNTKTNRIIWVDNVKAFACFLVVLGHLLQSLNKITPNYLYKYVAFIIYFVFKRKTNRI